MLDVSSNMSYGGSGLVSPGLVTQLVGVSSFARDSNVRAFHSKLHLNVCDDEQM